MSEEVGKGSLVENLDIRPEASIYRVFSRLSYKPWYAIAEFVDNSTASFYKNQKALAFYNIRSVTIDITYNQEKGFLLIEDNAYGMEIDDFRRAILLDARPEYTNGRNEFGMGLKTSASWFGDVWTVTSTRLGSEHEYTATVDIPLLVKTKSNTVEIRTKTAPVGKHGTTILIRNMTKPLNGSLTKAKIKDVLRSMYRRDLKTGSVIICWNDEPLEFLDYKPLVQEKNEWKKQIDFTFEYGEETHHVSGFVGILGEDDSGFKKAGFALFRRNRVVIGEEGNYYKPKAIFGEAQSKISHKLYGELDLDDFPINQAKDGFSWDGGLEEAFVEALKEQIPDYIEMADLTIKARTQKSEVSPENVNSVHDSCQKALDSLSNQEAPAQGQTDSADPLAEFRNAADRVFKPTVFEETTREYEIPTGEFSKEKIKVTWANSGDGYWFDYNKESKTLVINIAHPFFVPYAEDPDFKVVISKLVLALVLSERFAEKGIDSEGLVSVDDLNDQMNKILKGLKGK
jgi:hypothetical protein